MMTSGDDDPMMIDKESEDLLGVLPDDLPFKDDDLLGILSGSKGTYYAIYCSTACNAAFYFLIWWLTYRIYHN